MDSELLLLAIYATPFLCVLLIILNYWRKDYKNWKDQKNKPRILNPWSDY